MTERAHEFKRIARMMSIGTYIPVSEKIPAVTDAMPNDFNLAHWDLLWQVAYTWVAHSRVSIEVPVSDRLSVSSILLQDLEGAHPFALRLFEDLDKFVADRLDVMRGADWESVLKGTLGLWILWNATRKATIADERVAISRLGHMCYHPIVGYWTGTGLIEGG